MQYFCNGQFTLLLSSSPSPVCCLSFLQVADVLKRPLHYTGQIADNVYGVKQFADVNVVDRGAHGGGGVMVLADVCYGQQTQVHFIDGILNDSEIP